MTGGEVLGLFVESTGLLLARVTIIIFLCAYLIFSLMVVRQTVLLNRLLQTSLSWLLDLLSWFHLLFALGILVFSLFSLKIVG